MDAAEIYSKFKVSKLLFFSLFHISLSTICLALCASFFFN